MAYQDHEHKNARGANELEDPECQLDLPHPLNPLLRPRAQHAVRLALPEDLVGTAITSVSQLMKGLIAAVERHGAYRLPPLVTYSGWRFRDTSGPSCFGRSGFGA